MEFLAPRIANLIYDNTLKAIRERLSQRIIRFAEECKDAYTLLIHVALKLIDDPVIPHNHDSIRELLLQRLTNDDSPSTNIALEVEKDEL